jgi:hypothetical protein
MMPIEGQVYVIDGVAVLVVCVGQTFCTVAGYRCRRYIPLAKWATMDARAS